MSAVMVLDQRVGSGVGRRWMPYLLVWLSPALLTGFFHLKAIGLVDTPGGPTLTALHGVVAVFANMLGPWAGLIVALVDFPNAGLRSFNVFAAVGLTALYAVNVFVGVLAERTLQRRILYAQFLVLTLVWYGYGFYLIADGLL
jgi:hypothetical protein